MDRYDRWNRRLPLSPPHIDAPIVVIVGVTALVALVLGLTACSATTGSDSTPLRTAAPSPAPVTPLVPLTPTAIPTVPSFSHVFLVVLENERQSGIIGQSDAPYLNQLARQFGYAANYYGVAHPSLPNYLALTGGDTFGINSDCINCIIPDTNLVDQLEAHGKTWKAYMEDMPTPCYTGNDTGLYAMRHNPFLHYSNIRDNPRRCANDVPLTELQTDLADHQVPDFVWITPNLCHDMHNCSPRVGDQWLSGFIPTILQSDAWKNGGVLFITFDEGATNDGCCEVARGGKVTTLVIAPNARPGYQSTVAYDHYSLVRTIEESWSLGYLRNAGRAATHSMAEMFVQSS